MVVDVGKGRISHHIFADLPRFLRPADALVLNETKVLPARIVAHKPSGGEVELMFLRDLGGPWEVLARPSKRLGPGLVLSAGGGGVGGVKRLGGGEWRRGGADGLEGPRRRLGGARAAQQAPRAWARAECRRGGVGGRKGPRRRTLGREGARCAGDAPTERSDSATTLHRA